MISLLFCECMIHAFVYLVHLLSLAWVFPSLIVVTSFPYSFVDSHGVFGFILCRAFDFQKVLELGEVVSGKSQGLGVEMVFSKELSTGGWRQENSSRYGERILRHTIFFWLCDLLTGFGKIVLA